MSRRGQQKKTHLVLFQPAAMGKDGRYSGPVANGLTALAIYLSNRGYRVRICHLNGYEGSPADLVREKLGRHHPEKVGINLTWHTHCAQALEMVAAVKRYSHETVVMLGGPTASLFDVCMGHIGLSSS